MRWQAWQAAARDGTKNGILIVVSNGIEIEYYFSSLGGGGGVQPQKTQKNPKWYFKLVLGFLGFLGFF